jgi:hypothetical protein
MSGNRKRDLPREAQEPEVGTIVQEKPTDARIRTIRRELGPVPDTLGDFYTVSGRSGKASMAGCCVHVTTARCSQASDRRHMRNAGDDPGFGLGGDGQTKVLPPWRRGNIPPGNARL